MAFSFNLSAVPTGSVAISFKKEESDVLPTEVKLSLTDSSLVETITDPLTVYASMYIDWYQIALTTPVTWDTEYTVSVLFDDVVVHTFDEPVELPAPGKRRLPVLRQRLFEKIFSAYQDGDIDIRPYGDAHKPSSVGIDGKALKGTIIEIMPGYVESMEYDNSTASIRQATVPFKAYASMDNPEDMEELATDVEEVLDYLLETSWSLNSFGLIQSSASCEAGSPEMNEDRRLATIEGAITVSMRRKF